ncbi:hypothetical protein ACOMHN_028641 [Nucella lapillus]
MKQMRSDGLRATLRNDKLVTDRGTYIFDLEKQEYQKLERRPTQPQQRRGWQTDRNAGHRQADQRQTDSQPQQRSQGPRQTTASRYKENYPPANTLTQTETQHNTRNSHNHMQHTHHSSVTGNKQAHNPTASNSKGPQHSDGRPTRVQTARGFGRGRGQGSPAATTTHTSNHEIVSCSGAGSIYYTQVEREDLYGKCLFDCHTGTTYELVVVPNEAQTFLTCGEDGTVRWYDLRIKTSCSKERCKEDVLINCRSAVTSISVDPILPYQLATACADGSVRVFDRRMLGTRLSGTYSSRLMTGLVSRFMAPMENQAHRITSLNYSPYSHYVLVSYSAENVYLFNTQIEDSKEFSKAEPEVETKGSVNGEEASATGGADPGSQPPTKRLRLRGDWSDTGPNARPERERTEDTEGLPQVNLMQRMSDMLTRWLDGTMRRRGDDQGERSTSPGGGGAQEGEDNPDGAGAGNVPDTPEQGEGGGEGRGTDVNREQAVAMTEGWSDVDQPGQLSQDRAGPLDTMDQPGQLSQDRTGPLDTMDQPGQLSQDRTGPLDNIVELEERSCSVGHADSPLPSTETSQTPSGPGGGVGSSGSQDGEKPSSGARSGGEEPQSSAWTSGGVDVAGRGQSVTGDGQAGCEGTSGGTEVSAHQGGCGQCPPPPQPVQPDQCAGETARQAQEGLMGRIPPAAPDVFQPERPEVRGEEGSVDSPVQSLPSSQGVVVNAVELGERGSEHCPSQPLSATLPPSCSLLKAVAVAPEIQPDTSQLQDGRAQFVIRVDHSKGSACPSPPPSCVDSEGEERDRHRGQQAGSEETVFTASTSSQGAMESGQGSHMSMQGSSGSSHANSAAPMTRLEPVISLHYSSEGTTASTIQVAYASFNIVDPPHGQSSPSQPSPQPYNLPSSVDRATAPVTAAASVDRPDIPLSLCPHSTPVTVIDTASASSSHTLLGTVDSPRQSLSASVVDPVPGVAPCGVGSEAAVHVVTQSSGSPGAQACPVAVGLTPPAVTPVDSPSAGSGQPPAPFQGPALSHTTLITPAPTSMPGVADPLLSTPGSQGGEEEEEAWTVMCPAVLHCAEQQDQGTSPDSTAPCCGPSPVPPASSSAADTSQEHVPSTSSAEASHRETRVATGVSGGRQRRFGHSGPPTGDFQLVLNEENEDESDDEDDSREGIRSRSVPFWSYGASSNDERHYAAMCMQSMYRRRMEEREKQAMASVFQPQPLRMYSGHRNSRTMIKESNFWGDQVVMSGSDCGRIFVWDRDSTQLIMLLEADRHVVNCLQPHPFDPILASSGIDYDVKIWSPLECEPCFDTEMAEKVMRRNQVMLEETRDTITVPAAFMLRVLASLNQIRAGRAGGPPARHHHHPSPPDSD